MLEVQMIIRGKVQGVFFRASAQEKAKKLGLKGYARNLEDGSVEILAQGPDEKIYELLQWCREGPRLSRVEKLEEKGRRSIVEYSYNGFSTG